MRDDLYQTFQTKKHPRHTLFQHALHELFSAEHREGRGDKRKIFKTLAIIRFSLEAYSLRIYS